jgi:hypothetical protein
MKAITLLAPLLMAMPVIAEGFGGSYCKGITAENSDGICKVCHGTVRTHIFMHLTEENAKYLYYSKIATQVNVAMALNGVNVVIRVPVHKDGVVTSTRRTMGTVRIRVRRDLRR